jgi:proline iminopeptidase
MKKIVLFFMLIFILAACGTKLPQKGEFTTKINGVNLWYKVAGQGNKVLFIQAPSQGTGVDIFVQTMKPLEDDFTLVYYDPRGSGQSERNPNPEKITVGQVVEDLEALRAYLGIESFALFGQSNGSLVALNYAAKYPDYLTHLILTNDGIGDPPEYSETKIGEMAADETYLEAVMALGDIGSATNDEEFTDWFRTAGVIYCWDVAACRAYMDNVSSNAMDLETFFAISMTSDQFSGVYDELSSIQVPTLVVAGEHDAFNSVQAGQNLANGLPNGELMVLENCNHMPTMDNPEVLFASISEFINR